MIFDRAPCGSFHFRQSRDRCNLIHINIRVGAFSVNHFDIFLACDPFFDTTLFIGHNGNVTMKWEKCSTELSDILASAMVNYPAQRRVMFGCPAYFVNGNMAAGVHGSGIFIRLSDPDRKLFLKTFDESTLFEPVTGRVMKEYVAVPAGVYDTPAQFHIWLNKAIKYAAALPPKIGKPPRAKKEK